MVNYNHKGEVMLDWKNEIENIQTRLDNGETTESIGAAYGVSKQRIYQVMTKFGLCTNIKTRKNFLRDKTIKHYWFNHLLTRKKISRELRLFLLDKVELPDVCPVLGLVLNYSGTGREGFSREENSPSIDQIVPSKGYTLDNVCIISWRANRIKNDGTPEEHFKIYDYFSNLTKNKLQV